MKQKLFFPSLAFLAFSPLVLTFFEAYHFISVGRMIFFGFFLAVLVLWRFWPPKFLDPFGVGFFCMLLLTIVFTQISTRVLPADAVQIDGVCVQQEVTGFYPFWLLIDVVEGGCPTAAD